MGDFWTTFFYFIVMIAILAGAYFTTKFIAGKGNRVKSRNIRMIDRMMVGKDKQIVLIEVGDKNLLIGVTNQAINVLGDIDGETLTAQSESGASAQKGFASQLKDFILRMKDAPGNLNKARAEAKKDKWPREMYEDDYLSRMDEAIQKRKGRPDGHDGEGQ
jgi:flagellar biosynthetic protein FliO